LPPLRGRGVTAAIRKAAEERLQRIRRDKGGRSLADDLMSIGERCAALPDLDDRPAESILGYDEHGIPPLLFKGDDFGLTDLVSQASPAHP
jgi:antitoxin VapB